MSKKEFSVHKHIVTNNRKGFYLWAMKNNKIGLFEQVSKDWVVLDHFDGDRIPLKIVSQENKKIADIANEPNLGIKIIQIADMKQSPFYKVLNSALSPALSQKMDLPITYIIRLIGHFFQILTEVVSLKLEEFSEGIKVKFIPNMPDLVSYHQIEGAMFGICRLIAHFTNIWPKQIELEHIPSIIDYDLYLEVFRCTPKFLQDKNQLIYYFNMLLCKNEHALFINPLFHSAEKQFPNVFYQERVRILLCTTLGFLSPCRKNIADIMSMTVKTMQRRLAEEGISFNEILLDVRKSQVIYYLGLQQFTIEQIGLFVGYKAKSQFLKAFKQWFDMTPNEYRVRILHLTP